MKLQGACTQAVLAAAIFLQSAGSACGQPDAGFPARPVRFIVPFPPGGGTDIVARTVGQKLGDELHQPFILDNRPGAAGTVGAALTAKSTADGYTMMLATASFAISASYYRKLPYDSVKDFSGVARVALSPQVLLAHPSVPANSIRELVALAKARPGALNLASSGEGGVAHLAGALFVRMAGIQATHIAYRGASPARIALLSGEAQLLVAPLGPSIPDIQSGKARGLGVSSAHRSSLLPDLPTIAESGYPGYEADTWYGVVVPRNTPRTAIAILNRAILQALTIDSLVRQLAAQGIEPAGSTPAQFDEYLRSEIAKWAKTMQDAGVRQN